MESNNLYVWKDALIHENIRKEIIESGEKCGEKFLNEREDPLIS